MSVDVSQSVHKGELWSIPVCNMLLQRLIIIIASTLKPGWALQCISDQSRHKEVAAQSLQPIPPKDRNFWQPVGDKEGSPTLSLRCKIKEWTYI